MELSFGPGGHLTGREGLNGFAASYSAARHMLRITVTTMGAAGSSSFPPYARAADAVLFNPSGKGGPGGSVGPGVSKYAINTEHLTLYTGPWTLRFVPTATP